MGVIMWGPGVGGGLRLWHVMGGESGLVGIIQWG